MLAPFIPGFKSSLSSLWANPIESSTIYQTADLIEAIWVNAVVTGYEISPCVMMPKSTYPAPGFDLLAPGTIGPDASYAASCFEAACSQMVLQTLFPLIPPPVSVPPPIPIGAAIPGALTTLLTSIFIAGSTATVEFQTAPQVADAIAAYLQGWMITVITVPSPPVTVVLPII